MRSEPDYGKKVDFLLLSLLLPFLCSFRSLSELAKSGSLELLVGDQGVMKVESWSCRQNVRGLSYQLLLLPTM